MATSSSIRMRPFKYLFRAFCRRQFFALLPIITLYYVHREIKRFLTVEIRPRKKLYDWEEEQRAIDIEDINQMMQDAEEDEMASKNAVALPFEDFEWTAMPTFQTVLRNLLAFTLDMLEVPEEMNINLMEILVRAKNTITVEQEVVETRSYVNSILEGIRSVFGMQDGNSPITHNLQLLAKKSKIKQCCERLDNMKIYDFLAVIWKSKYENAQSEWNIRSCILQILSNIVFAVPDAAKVIIKSGLLKTVVEDVYGDVVILTKIDVQITRLMENVRATFHASATYPDDTYLLRGTARPGLTKYKENAESCSISIEKCK